MKVKRFARNPRCFSVISVIALISDICYTENIRDKEVSMSFALFKDEAIVPKAHDIDLALESSKALASLLPRKEKKEVGIKIAIGDREADLQLPYSALKLFLQILTEMAAGNAITLIPIHAELTTQEAANLLHVSRPFLVGLLEQGKLPFHKVGTHRRIKFQDLKNFQKEFEQKSRKALDELAEQAQKLDMGY